MDVLNSAIIGIITGLFSAGTIWGILKTEIAFLRRDVDSLMHFVYKRRHDEP